MAPQRLITFSLGALEQAGTSHKMKGSGRQVVIRQLWLWLGV